MEDVESSVTQGDVGGSDSRSSVPTRGRSAVEVACQAAGMALGAYLRLAETEAGDDSFVARTSAQLSTMLAGVSAEACESLMDVRAKLSVFRQLQEVLPSDDLRLQIFVFDLVRDLAVFLHCWNIH